MEYTLIGAFAIVCLIASGVYAYNEYIEYDIVVAGLFMLLGILLSFVVTLIFGVVVLSLVDSFGYYAYLILGSLPVIGYGGFLVVKLIHEEIYGG
jgi:hypothetical protein